MNNSIPSQKIAAAARAGYENTTVWADLLDRINVFPVADGDTGMNLRVSLAPLRDCDRNLESAVAQLAASGRGNSGNIAVAFFREFLSLAETGLAAQARKGRAQAWKAIANPCRGTMLAVFDALCSLLDEVSEEALDFLKIRRHLQRAVLATEKQLSELSDAGVVDSGALGMFCFFDGFFQEYTGQKIGTSPVMELFGDSLCINTSFQPSATDEYCVEARLVTKGQKEVSFARVANLGNSVVVVPDDSGVKIHLHTRNPEQLRDKLSLLGDVMDWSNEAMGPMIGSADQKSFSNNKVRIMCDAAGSIPLELARTHGIILLDSYILACDQANPESLFSPEQLYVLMNDGIRVTTAQASSHERHLHYQAAIQQYEKVLYLCTGSAFTGNYLIARAWQKKHDSNDQFLVLDTGAASGKLAVIAILTARFAEEGSSAEKLVEYAEKLSHQVQEYVFIHELKHLVAGGRVSRAKGFFGDLLHMKPVISPGFGGVKKLGVVRNRDAQLEFATTNIKRHAENANDLFILLQYTDNKNWLMEVVEPRIRTLLPAAEILLVPLSLTSGVHMGPGTWSLAFASHMEAANVES
jgi:DegV family protein with EDD domain